MQLVKQFVKGCDGHPEVIKKLHIILPWIKEKCLTCSRIAPFSNQGMNP